MSATKILILIARNSEKPNRGTGVAPDGLPGVMMRAQEDQVIDHRMRGSGRRLGALLGCGGHGDAGIVADFRRNRSAACHIFGKAQHGPSAGSCGRVAFGQHRGFSGQPWQSSLLAR
jgi:hypothetical protein